MKTPMKTIGLMLTRNEGHILPYTLPPLAQVCDHIIIADQNSTDDTRAIINKCTKATLIDNPPSPPDGNYHVQGHNLLLDTARNFDGHNILMCIDADEITPPAVFSNIKERIATHYKKGTGFITDWVRLWKKSTRYCLSWHNHFHVPRHAKFFYDDRQCRYTLTCWVHSGRVPHNLSQGLVLLKNAPILHCHWVFWQRALWQQAWYHIMEFKNARFDTSHIQRINHFYHDPALHGQRVLTRSLPKKLRQGYQPPPLHDNAPDWRKDDVWKMIEKHGLETFEPLNIWYVSELKERFEQEMKRPPQWQSLPKISVPLQQLRQWQHDTGTDNLRDAIKIPERAIRRTTWYKKLKGKKT